MTGQATTACMNLGTCGEWSRGCGMAADAVCGVRRGSHIDCHLWSNVVAMVVGMTVKVGAMAGRTGLILALASSRSKQDASGVVVAGLAAQGCMCLTRANKRCGGCAMTA